jgi:UDP-N-acetylmuramoylalanine--D-glutamate ligase
VVANDGKPREALSGEALSLERAGATLATGGHRQARMGDADLIVLSPGVPALPEIAEAEQRGVPIWGEVELSTRSLAHPAPIVAVGGTNGKSTTTTLVGELLAEAGMRTFVGGNLGEPLADHVDETFDAIVLEVSSFQMERIDRFRPHVAVLLNVTEDHLDRYPNFEEYARAKGNAFVRQVETDWAVIPFDDALCRHQAERGRAQILTFGPGGIVDVTSDAIVDTRDAARFPREPMGLAGGHNALNAAAAVACARALTVPLDAIGRVLRGFRGLPHRMSLVAEVRGVRFYDDSKGTNVGAAVTALEGLQEEKAVLIAGGRDKGGSYEPLAAALARKGRAAVVLGEAAEAIAKTLAGRVPVMRAQSMREAVRLGATLAVAGDAVLLSPACSSFDMFRDYKHRGDEFARCVRELGEVSE